MASLPKSDSGTVGTSSRDRGKGQVGRARSKTPYGDAEENRCLELSGAELKRLTALALTHLASFLDETDGRPASSVAPVEVPEREKFPEAGEPAGDILSQLFEDIIPEGVDTTNPRYFGYIPGGGLPLVAVADLIAGVVNRYVGVRHMAPACARIEDNVVRWLCDIVGLGQRAGGFLTSGGSLANWSAIVTATRQRLGSQFADGIIYTSDQTHHSIKKAALLAGVPVENIRFIKSDENLRICIDELRKQMATDLESGGKPCVVVGNAGTTNTGAVDDLDKLADVAADHGLWFHVDAAYGGFFALTDAGKRILKGLGRANSITLDPHKGLFLPYGTGSLLVSDVNDLKSVYEMPAPYIVSDNDGPTDLADVSPELTRAFRALRIWLPLKMHGIGPFRDNLSEKLQLAHWLYEELSKLPFVEAMLRPQLSTVTFRFCPPQSTPEMLNSINLRALRFINERRNVYITPTTLRDRFVLRICILSFRSHREHVEQFLEEVCAAATELCMSSSSSI